MIIILEAVLVGCVIAMLISLHKLGTILDRMVVRTTSIRLGKDFGIKDPSEKAIDDFIAELNKRQEEDNKWR